MILRGRTGPRVLQRPVAALLCAATMAGHAGNSLFENPGVVHNSAREYRMCAAWRAATGDSKVQIQYNYAAHGGPQRVVYKQHY